MILTLAYPETIVRVSDEWYSPYLRFLGIGKKNYLRAGHAALLLVDKTTGDLEYYDFGRYITPQPMGRVRSKETDAELTFPFKAELTSKTIKNLDVILKFLATQPKLTHGEGTLYASVCEDVDYDKAKAFIKTMMDKHLIKYAAFEKKASNCARFVTDTLIASTTNPKVRKRLKRSKWFTPSTVANVVNADTIGRVYKVDSDGKIGLMDASVWEIHKACFLDRLEEFEPNFQGALFPKHLDIVADHAQWLPGLAAGAWFELHKTKSHNIFKFKRISPHGNIDVEAFFEVKQKGFDYHTEYRFVHYSNCMFFHIKQNENIFRFEKIS